MGVIKGDTRSLDYSSYDHQFQPTEHARWAMAKRAAAMTPGIDSGVTKV